MLVVRGANSNCSIKNRCGAVKVSRLSSTPLRAASRAPDWSLRNIATSTWALALPKPRPLIVSLTTSLTKPAVAARTSAALPSRLPRNNRPIIDVDDMPSAAPVIWSLAIVRACESTDRRKPSMPLSSSSLVDRCNAPMSMVFANPDDDNARSIKVDLMACFELAISVRRSSFCTRNSAIKPSSIVFDDVSPVFIVSRTAICLPRFADNA